MRPRGKAPAGFAAGRLAPTPVGPFAVSKGAFADGNTILGIGVRAQSGGSIAGFKPTLRFDLDNDSYRPASAAGATDGRTSFGSFSEQGDFTVQFEGGSSWRGSTISVQAGSRSNEGTPEKTTYTGTPDTVLLPGGVGSGTSYDFAFRAFAQPAANAYQMFIDMTAIPRLYGNTDPTSVYKVFFPNKAGVGPIGDRVTVSLNGLGTNNVVFGADLTLLDLDVDSNNDGTIDLDNSPLGTDDRVEDIAGVDATPGLYLQVQDEDSDGDGIVNWADGFNGIGGEVTTDDQSAGASFAPMLVRIPTDFYAPDATLEILYSASGPSAAIMDPHYLSWDRPTDGHLRIWTKDAFLPRNRNPVQEGGDYVAPTSRTARSYTLAELGLQPGDNRLFLEAIRESTTTAQQQVTFRLTPRIAGKPATFTISDTVRVTTARIEVLADNRDGTPAFPTFSMTATPMPNPNAGLSGLVPDITQAYTINVYDPRGPQTIHTTYVAGTPLPLVQSGTARYTTPQFLAVPEEDLPLIVADLPVEGLLDGPLHPSDVIGQAIVVPVSGTVVQIRYNGETWASRISVKTVELADKLFWQVAEAVAKDMVGFTPTNDDGKNVGGNFRGTPGRYDTSFSGAYGHEFEARLHKRFDTLAAQGNALAKRFKQGFIVDVNDLISATHSKDSRQIDVLFLREGYDPKVGDFLDKKQTIVYEVKTSFSGNVPGDQLRKLRPLSELEVRSIHSNIRYMADGLGGFRVGPNTRFQAYVRAWKGLGAYVLKHTPEILIGTTVVVRAMSAEAAEREDVLLGELEAAFIKADSLRSKAGEFELQKTVVWEKIDAILENRGIELNNLVKHRVLQKVLSP